MTHTACLPNTGASTLDWILAAVGLAMVVVGIFLVVRNATGAGATFVVLALVLGVGLAVTGAPPAAEAAVACSPVGAGAPAPGDPGAAASRHPSASPSSSASPSARPSPAAAFKIASADWRSPLGQQFACSPADAPNDFGVSPQVSWANPPAGTVAYAVRIVDLDAAFSHWTVLNLPATTTSLARGASGTIPAPAEEKNNDFGFAGYGGPCPPAGESHTYELTVYALKATVADAAGIDAATLASDRLTVTYP